MPQRGTQLLPGRSALLLALFIATAGAAMTLGTGGRDTLFTARSGGSASSDQTVPVPVPDPVPVMTTPPAPVTSRPAPRPLATLPPTTLPAPPDDRSFELSPASGVNSTPVVASGGGCTGYGAGVSLEVLDPTGRPYTTDGALSLSDGTWRVDFPFAAEVPTGYLGGTYTVRATCRVDTQVLFVYDPQEFTLFG